MKSPALAVVSWADITPAGIGAVFKDLLSIDLPNGRSLADGYLRRRGWNDSVATRDDITALRCTPISLFEVNGMVLRDLVRGGDPVRVVERSGARGVRQWDRIATRRVHIRDAPSSAAS